MILVVDDDEQGRTCVAELLTDAGFAVLTASDGSDALLLLRSEGAKNVQLIFLDIDMPVMTGGEFLLERAADESLGIIPVVVTSAMPRPMVGSDDMLAKPLDLEKLLALANVYCNR